MRYSKTTKLTTFVSLTLTLLLATLATLASPVFASPTTATFSGTATIHIVLADGTQIILSNVPYSVTFTAGGDGVGTLSLNVPSLSISGLGGFLATGEVTVTSDHASGGGTIAPPHPSQFGFTASSSGGQFECLAAGFSAPANNGGPAIRQFIMHGSITPGTFSTS